MCSFQHVYNKVNNGNKKYFRCEHINFSANYIQPGVEVIKHFSCSTQLGIIFQLLIKFKMLKNNFKFSDVFFMPLNVKMPTLLVFEHLGAC